MLPEAIQQKSAVIAENVPFEEFLITYEGQRVEWHAGKVIELVTNNTKHNLILGFLYQLLVVYLDLRSLGKVILAGVPMYIANDQPAHEPDLMILLNSSLDRLSEHHLEGPADMVIEIVSPGTGYIDRGAKFVEYENVGVREYWLIDPIREELLAYHLGDKGHYQRIELDPDKRIQSSTLPGFVIDPAVLWQEEMPAGMAVVEMAQAMTTNQD